jgi:hypothetical protein
MNNELTLIEYIESFDTDIKHTVIEWKRYFNACQALPDSERSQLPDFIKRNEVAMNNLDIKAQLFYLKIKAQKGLIKSDKETIKYLLNWKP